MTARIIFGLFFLAIGVSALTNFDIFHYIVPLLFIFIGLRILLGRGLRSDGIHSGELHQDEINEVAVFSGSRKQIVSGNFSGGKAVAVFSGMELDLTQVKTREKSMELELVAVFGGLKVTVPKEWRVIADGAGIVGGYTNNTSGGKDSAPKLVIHGAAIFGGVDIVN